MILNATKLFLFFQWKKKQTENKENNLATGRYLTANPAIPSRSGIAVERASLHAASPKRSDLHLVLVLAGVQ